MTQVAEAVDEMPEVAEEVVEMAKMAGMAKLASVLAEEGRNWGKKRAEKPEVAGGKLH